MNIRNVQTSAARLAARQLGETSRADEATPAVTPAAQPNASPDAPRDRFEHSGAAETAQAQDLATAKAALRSADAMPEARLNELRERVESGYYQQPEVVKEVSQRVARDLLG